MLLLSTPPPLGPLSTPPSLGPRSTRRVGARSMPALLSLPPRALLSLLSLLSSVHSVRHACGVAVRAWASAPGACDRVGGAWEGSHSSVFTFTKRTYCRSPTPLLQLGIYLLQYEPPAVGPAPPAVGASCRRRNRCRRRLKVVLLGLLQEVSSCRRSGPTAGGRPRPRRSIRTVRRVTRKNHQSEDRAKPGQDSLVHLNHFRSGCTVASSSTVIRI